MTILSKGKVREIFMAHGFTIKEGQGDLKPYVYAAANALVEAAVAAARANSPAPLDWTERLNKDAERYRFLAGHCRSTSEHWGGRWSIVIEGPCPKSHNSEGDFDAAIDAAVDRAKKNESST